MIRGGALFYAIFVSIIICISSGFICMLYNYLSISDRKLEILQRINNSVIYLSGYLITNPLMDSKTNRINHLGGSDSIVFSASGWGVFKILSCDIYINNSVYRRQFLAGNINNRLDKYSLRVDETHEQVGFLGTPQIDNKCYLPFGKIKANKENGYDFITEKDLGVKVLASDFSISNVSESIADSVLSAIRELIGERKDSTTDAVINSFNDPVKIIYVRSSSVIKNFKAGGNVILWSDGSLKFNQSSQIENIIVFARSIDLSHFSGSGQFIATDSIIVRDETTLNYPSSLLLLSEKKEGMIQIQSASSVEGEVLGFHSRKKNSYVNIYIDKSTKVKGFVICDGNVDCSGSLEGSLWTENVYKLAGATNIPNVLESPRILRNNLPEFYVGNVFDLSIMSGTGLISPLN